MKPLRLIVFLIATALTLQAAYDTVLLKMHAKVFPKMIMTDTEIDRKVIGGAIVVAILYDRGEAGEAHRLQTLIEELYPSVGAYRLEVQIIPYSRFDEPSPLLASALFLLDSSSGNVRKAVVYAQEHALVTYAYNPAYLRQGVLLSLYIDQKTRPYLNLSEAKSYNIRFSTILLKIAKLL